MTMVRSSFLSVLVCFDLMVVLCCSHLETLALSERIPYIFENVSCIEHFVATI